MGAGGSKRVAPSPMTAGVKGVAGVPTSQACHQVLEHFENDCRPGQALFQVRMWHAALCGQRG